MTTHDGRLTTEVGGRSWDCHDTVPEHLLMRLAKLLTREKRTRAWQRDVCRTSVAIFAAAVVDREAFARLDEQILEATDWHQVLPDLLRFYAPAGSAVDSYVNERQKRMGHP